MKPITKILHIPPATNGRIVITCPQCKKCKRVNVSALPKSSKPLKTRCGCGCIFRLVIDTRDGIKKSMNLTGAYTKVAKFGSQGYGFFDVKEMSLTGLTFSTRGYHIIQVGELLKINFALDNTKSSEIQKIVHVKYVDNHSIHAEFCNKKKLETALIRYLEAS